MSKIFFILLIFLTFISCATRDVSTSYKNAPGTSRSSDIASSGEDKAKEAAGKDGEAVELEESPEVVIAYRTVHPSSKGIDKGIFSLPLPELPDGMAKSLALNEVSNPPGPMQGMQMVNPSDKQLERQLRVPVDSLVKFPVSDKFPERSAPERQLSKSGQLAENQSNDHKPLEGSIEKYSSFVVRDKDRVVIPLDGRGWIFFGASYKDENNTEVSPVITFLDKVTRENSTDFFFKAEALGEYVLNFQQQSNGKPVSMVVNLKVEKKTEDSDVQGEDNLKGDTVTRVKTVEELLDNGEYPQVIENMGKDKGLDTILSFGVHSRKVSALVFIADELNELKKIQDLNLKVGSFSLLSKGGKILISEGIIKQGVKLLESSLLFGEEEYGGDEVLYILGYTYQNESSIRDERKAVSYYKRLLEDYPGSLYWDEARGAYVFLKRRYIDVR